MSDEGDYEAVEEEEEEEYIIEEEEDEVAEDEHLQDSKYLVNVILSSFIGTQKNLKR